ncbi:MAG: alpha-glucosidase/alpha-galactosidase [Clostridia bacterium]|nr:alpha-glucosidase/alpha-galactosidase [Clostridia bacterium]
MIYTENGVKDIKIAYIGGGSRGWAWKLMSDLATTADLSGTVDLYDIDLEAAKNNEIIGNMYNEAEGARSHWNYRATETIGEALTGADFVIISILPGTFKEMESDVHTPEKYGIYQPVGDTTGPGGIIRALRTIPMMEEIASAVEKYCPKAWVINYTNPMALCVKALYNTFPEIRAFGCCHEVFAVQELLTRAVKETTDAPVNNPRAVRTNVVGVNHFTWITDAQYHDVDVFAAYEKFIEMYPEGIKRENPTVFECDHLVKFDLFRRYGAIAAAGDRHLAEFCPGDWYLESPEQVRAWGFDLTPVSWRVDDLADRLERGRKLRSGEEKIVIQKSGEEGVRQIRALLGLGDLVTNVNLPNRGQIPNLPLGTIVETNATFTDDRITPVQAGSIPEGIYALVARIADEQALVSKAAKERDLELAFLAFVNNPLVRLNMTDARKLFDEMVANTSAYLGDYLK